MNKKAIGIFDSGIGGLTVYKALKKKMPKEKIIYLGDTARLPYGSKSAQTIIDYSHNNANFLLKRDVKVVVVACNSASSHGVPVLQNIFKIPIIGVIQPGARAVINSQSKKVGIIGTRATINSKAYEKAIKTIDSKIEILSKSCPFFVPIVEEGWLNHRITPIVIEDYLKEFKEAGIESLVLGCTHYPLLKGKITEYMGNKVNLIDSGEATAEIVESILLSLGWLNKEHYQDEDEFYVSDFPERFKEVGSYFLNQPIDKVEIVKI